MVTLDGISCFLNTSILDEWFSDRENILATLTPEDKENLDSLFKARKKNHAKILAAINNVPPAFIETKKDIESRIDDYLGTTNCINGYYNEKYYKCGFCDGVKLIVEALNEQKENSKP